MNTKDRFRELYEADIARYGGSVPFLTRRFHYYLRRMQTCGNSPLRGWYHLRFRAVSFRLRTEISSGAAIGKGFCLTDPHLATVNSNAVIGENVTFGRNVTIGKQNRGKLEGSPVIGNRVRIGDGAVIVGKITVGDDAVIAPGAYVNRDVPPDCTAAGNPCRILPREKLS